LKEKKGLAATRAKRKFNDTHYDRLYPYVKKGRKSEYEQFAKSAGVSLNDFIITAIEEKILREKKERDENNTTTK